MADIEAEGKPVDKKTLQNIHFNKTAKLINLSLRFGALAAGAPVKELKALEEYGTNIGMAFQIVDDLLDIEGDSETLGKTVGKDEKSMKATFPAVYGLEKSRQMAQQYKEAAKKSVSILGEKAALLNVLADYITDRNS